MQPNQYESPAPTTAMPVDEWFTQSGPPDAPLPNSPNRRKAIIGIIGVLLLATGLIVFFATRSSSPQSISCLTQTDYTDLVALITSVNDDGTSLDDVAPHQLLYTHNVAFVGGRTLIDDDTSPGTTTLLKGLDDYAKNKQSTAPITIHIAANYTSITDMSLLQQRMAKIRNQLIESGFDSSYIVTEAPSFVALDNETDFDGDDIVILSIAPAATCINTETP